MSNCSAGEGLESRVLGSPRPIKCVAFFKIQTVIKSHFLMPGTSNLAVLMFSTCFFPFLAFLKLQPIILWKVGYVMA